MAPKVYIETTIPSYLTSRPNRDIIVTGHQQSTREWWDAERGEYDLYISQLVIQECREGDRAMANERLELLAGIEIIPILPGVIQLAESLVKAGPLPEKAAADAVHIATAAASGMDYLLTWNLKHIANAKMQDAIRDLCKKAGFRPPEICTPEELMGE
ncbi:MAG: type II toxin-antitoxin system VapC family toxin [Pyrinomonadaceae bacterium]